MQTVHLAAHWLGWFCYLPDKLEVENNGLWYELQGDYYLPCLALPPEEEKPIDMLCNFEYNKSSDAKQMI